MASREILQIAPIVQLHLPEHVVERLRDLILSGVLPPGERLIERKLSDQLEVSRTPIREALFRLQSAGLVCERPGRGFFVAELSADEIVDIYQTIGALERTAVLHLDQFPASALREMRSAQRKFQSARGDVGQLIAADARWHQALTGASRNRKLLQALEPLRLVLTRYERVFFGHSTASDTSSREHEAITAMLVSGKPAAAAAAIEAHWMDNIEPMLQAIAAKEGRDCGDDHFVAVVPTDSS